MTELEKLFYILGSIVLIYLGYRLFGALYQSLITDYMNALDNLGKKMKDLKTIVDETEKTLDDIETERKYQSIRERLEQENAK